MAVAASAIMHSRSPQQQETYGQPPPYGAQPYQPSSQPPPPPPPAQYYGSSSPQYQPQPQYYSSSPPQYQASPYYSDEPKYNAYESNVYGKQSKPSAQNYPSPYDVNNPINYGPVEGHDVVPSIPTNVRHGFVRKVYFLLSLQLVYTFGFGLVFTLVDVAREWLQKHWWVALIFMVTGLILTIVLSCCPNVARSVPCNFIMLLLLTICMSWIVALGAAMTTSIAFAIAAGITLVVTVGLTIFAIQTKWDFTGCGVFVFVSVLILLMFGILAAVFQNRITHIVYASLAAALFSFYLVYDTQQIVGGKHRKYQYSIDDYIFAAITLYLDIINLFMMILSLTSASGN